MTMKWSAERIAGLGATTDLPTAASLLGIGRALAYELARRGELPFPVLRLGRRLIVPTAPLLKSLGLHEGAP